MQKSKLAVVFTLSKLLYIRVNVFLKKRTIPSLNLYISWYATRPFLTYGYQKKGKAKGRLMLQGT